MPVWLQHAACAALSEASKVIICISSNGSIVLVAFTNSKLSDLR